MEKEKKYADLTEEKIYQVNEIDPSLMYSYAHYLNWLFEDRVELIKGKIFKMSPAASRIHQEVFGAIFNPLYNFLKNQPCKVYGAPFDVRFPKKSKADKDVFTVLQPDICVVCDRNKLDDKGCIGAPDLVVEILSPGNNKKELLNKYQVYEEFGVREYWVVSQSDQNVLIYTRNELGKFQASKQLTSSELITSSVLPGFSLKLDDIFEQQN